MNSNLPSLTIEPITNLYFYWHALTILTAEGKGSQISPQEKMPSPIALDLDGNGVQTRSPAAGAHFDHANDGFAEQTGWVSQGDGLLERDLQGKRKESVGCRAERINKVNIHMVAA
ncbi:MAG: hypothetical protein V4454_21010 [Pseudomonadota bacterium]